MSQDSRSKFLAAKCIDGSLAGITGVTATFPLDLAKSCLQNQKITPGVTPKYTGMLQAVNVTFKEGGLVGCYSGYKVNVSFIVFEKSLKLVANDVCRLFLTDSNGNISLINECIAGGMAGTLQSSVTTPMELLKIKGQLAATKGEVFNTSQVMKSIYQQEGFRGFYRGWCSTLVRDIPFSFVYFPLYANLKNLEFFGQGKSFWGNLSCGMLAGIVGAAISTPTDVIKTRLQDMEGKGGKVSWISCAKQIASEKDGLKSFGKGLGPRMVCIGALFAVAQGFYELGLGKMFVDKVV